MEIEKMNEHAQVDTISEVKPAKNTKAHPAPGEKSLAKASRKIQKKRSKYKKIDDDVRMQLFEAVKKRGEMLKTVYSMAFERF